MVGSRCGGAGGIVFIFISTIFPGGGGGGAAGLATGGGGGGQTGFITLIGEDLGQILVGVWSGESYSVAIVLSVSVLVIDFFRFIVGVRDRFRLAVLSRTFDMREEDSPLADIGVEGAGELIVELVLDLS